MLPAFTESFIHSLEEEKLSNRTIDTYKYDLKLFFEWLNVEYEALSLEYLLELKRKDYDAYFTYQLDKGSSEAKMKRLAASLNKMLKFYDLSEKIGFLKPASSAQRPLVENDFVTTEETNRLLQSIASKRGLTDKQKPLYEKIAGRNLSIVLLMRNYGLTLTEVRQLNIGDINFAQNELRIYSKKEAANRTIYLNPEDKRIILAYYNDIPELFRPISYSSQPLFVAYNAKANSYHYNYNTEEPQRMSLTSIKDMVSREVKRSGIKRPISAVHLRNTCILEHIKVGEENSTILHYFGLTSRHALYRYKKYLK